MHRFYLPSLAFQKDELVIEDQRIVFQLTKVLRIKLGTKFHLFDEGGEWLVKVAEMGKKKIHVERLSEIQNQAEPRLKVALYQGIPKKPALFELIVQKATEIGVTEIYPFVTERTENRRMPKLDRLNLIAMEATEQCGRLKIPKIHYPVNYGEIIGKLSNGFIAYEYEAKHYLSDYRKEIESSAELQIIIGPEGGLSESEMSMAKEAGVKSFSLGKRILRTETAAIAALAQVLVER